MKRYSALLTLLACLACQGGVEPINSTSTPLHGPLRIGAMAPLTVGRFGEPYASAQENDWRVFRSDLAEAKSRGIDFVSFDVWWGVVERHGDESFDFAWVDRVINEITNAGLRFRPVLAFHACGGNVGDDCNIALPEWLSHVADANALSPNDLYFESAQGNISRETVSVWATPYVVDEYREFVRAFVRRYEHLASQSEGIVVGLGPASELRFPSYNSHDSGSGYPSSGVVQAYGALAQRDFSQWAMERYGSLTSINRNWGTDFARLADVAWPQANTLESFLDQNKHIETAYGRDMFDWYQSSLLEHGRIVLTASAAEINTTRFRDGAISARVPGVHWRSADSRRAELAAGMLNARTHEAWHLDSGDHGYSELLSLFAELRTKHPNVSVDYTCLEMGNGEGGAYAGSRAEDLVFWFADGAARRRIPIGGENALSSGLWSDRGWDRLHNVVRWSHYDTVTLLRLTDVVRSPYAQSGLIRLRHLD